MSELTCIYCGGLGWTCIYCGGLGRIDRAMECDHKPPAPVGGGEGAGRYMTDDEQMIERLRAEVERHAKIREHDYAENERLSGLCAERDETIFALQARVAELTRALREIAEKCKRLEAALRELVEAVTENTGSPDRVMLAVEQARRALEEK